MHTLDEVIFLDADEKDQYQGGDTEVENLNQDIIDSELKDISNRMILNSLDKAEIESKVIDQGRQNSNQDINISKSKELT